jgi:TfoX/Sxy family transcriptional regulator of competence genes
MAMPTPNSTALEALRSLLAEVCSPLPKVAERRMFGCDAFFAADTIFGLIWKAGRIGLKLPDRAHYEELLAMPGAAPWTAGDRTMAHWVLVPPEFHADPARLAPWSKRAHAAALAGPSAKPSKPTGVKARVTKSAKKPAAKGKAKQPRG